MEELEPPNPWIVFTKSLLCIYEQFINWEVSNSKTDVNEAQEHELYDGLYNEIRNLLTLTMIGYSNEVSTVQGIG